MAEYQIMYWKDVPIQVRAADVNREVSVALPNRFQEAIDALAMQEGLAGTDAYLEGWRWGEMSVLPGTAEEVAQAIAAEIEHQYPRQLDQMMESILKSRAA